MLLKNSVPSVVAVILSGKSVVPSTTTSAARAIPPAQRSPRARRPEAIVCGSARDRRSLCCMLSSLRVVEWDGVTVSAWTDMPRTPGGPI